MSFPNFTFWSHLLATVGLEVCCLAALGFVAQRLFRPADWQRAAWQMTVICLLLLPASEWTGLGRGAAGILLGQKRVVENAPASVFTAGKSDLAGGPVEVKLNRPPTATRPAVWWPGWVWLAGTAIILGRMAAAQVLLLVMRLRREKISTHSLRERVVSVANRVGLRRKVTLLLMPSAISPMAFGILRPSIGLPPGFEAKFSATEQEAVLAHELAHLAAMDPLWFLLADFASALLWWHPLAWWARRSLHLSAELAADEAAALVPDGPNALAKCLVTLGKEMTAAHAWAWVGINGGFRSNLGKRVERLTRMSGGANRPLVGWVGVAAKTAATILLVPTVVLLFGSFQSAHAQKEDTWRGEFRQSWNNSPAAALLLAQRDDQPQPNATNRVEYAQPFPENQNQIHYQIKVDYKDLRRRFPELGRTSTNAVALHGQVRQFLYNAGVRVTNDTGATVFFNDRRGEMLVQAKSWEDFEIALRAVRTLKQLPQVMITARFVELPPEDMPGLGFSGFNWFRGKSPTNDGAIVLRGDTTPSHQGPSATANPSGIFAGPNSPASEAILTNGLRDTATEANPTGIITDTQFSALVNDIEQRMAFSKVTGIMTGPQLRSAINAIEQRTGEDILTAPKVTTESGREARLSSDKNGSVTLDVIATVGSDGFSIATTATPTVKAGNQTWQVSASHKVWDGQTLVIGGAATDQPPGARKMPMVFITPRIIDPAGNPVHSDAELSKRPGIPDQ